MSDSALATERLTALYGIPLDRVTMDETIARIITLRDEFNATTSHPHLLATVNVDFVANSLSFMPGKVRHPELLDVLCRADIVTADGMPLIWLSRLCGDRLPERVTGADMVPRLAAESGRHNLRLFFLGGAGNVASQAADTLRQMHPDIQIAGIESPHVKTVGEDMLLSEKEDTQLVQRINAAKPDVLLVAFGNPKQEVWFNRNRYRLHIPVTIGVGGTFEFIAGTILRAPHWMQKAGLEWIWRITQDPWRLWKRYAIGMIKLATLTGSLVLFNLGGMLIARNDRLADNEDEFLLPPRITERTLAQLFPAIFRLQALGKVPLLNFKHTRSASLPALGALIRFLHQQADNGHLPESCNMGALFRLFLLGTHCLVPLRSALRGGATKRQRAGTPSRRFAYAIEEKNGVTILTLSGRLDGTFKSSFPTQKVSSALADKRVTIDASNLSFADSSGISLLLMLHNLMTQQGRTLHIGGAHGAVRQMLTITRLDKVFALHPSIDEAVKAAGGTYAGADVPSQPHPASKE
ncbi:WecB/TagA/CpsF family glycosyltransferase [Desulfovibrio subterraneus]|uniref:WecB/TagA/CpsF family glycosyl transferase n=1 Tax=Desulfovibrio subterraneus TaxID=2718620 RepID=A0A7J0BN77_9BACT|nr:WecB/TagA/CpsF family glycosyltransferase [Desulfovibrio subterraneus]GFM34464.1 WecB/TagA/CpsF family glycosyl transferase [Desulfovibrio subterraneus]